MEEESFYPAVREAIEEDNLMNEAVVEHKSAKQLIQELEGVDPSDRMYHASFIVLGEYLAALAQQIQERKSRGGG